jgi:hypothetical protein
MTVDSDVTGRSGADWRLCFKACGTPTTTPNLADAVLWVAYGVRP